MNQASVAARLLAASLCLLGYQTAGADWVLDFDDPGIVHGSVIDDQYSLANGGITGAGGALGVSISAIGGPDLAVAFNSTRSSTRDPDLEDGFYHGIDGISGSPGSYTYNRDYFPGNILIVQENNWYCGDGVCNYPDDRYVSSDPIHGGILTFSFSSPTILTGLDIFDIERTSDQRAYLEFFSDAAATTKITTAPSPYAPESTTNPGISWDAANARIEVLGTSPGDSADNSYLPLSFIAENVQALKVTFIGSGAVDNLRGFDLPSIEGQPIPAPSILLLLLPGLIGLRAFGKARKPN